MSKNSRNTRRTSPVARVPQLGKGHAHDAFRVRKRERAEARGALRKEAYG